MHTFIAFMDAAPISEDIYPLMRRTDGPAFLFDIMGGMVYYHLTREESDADYSLFKRRRLGG